MWKKFQIPEDYLKGRPDDATFKRWAQLVVKDTPAQNKSVLVRGYASHSGVLANFGRGGAAHGPESLRKAFYRLVAKADVQILDLGDVSDLQSTAESHKWVRENLPKENHALTVSFGGGHDWAAVDFDYPDMQLVHVDTHLDVRPYEKGKIHSGMPFRYLVEKGVRIWNFGAQEEYNSNDHWAFALENFKGLYSLDDVEKDFATHLDRCGTDIHPDRPVGLSIDLDAFPQSVSPGVSAPSPRGISLEHVVQIIDVLAKNLTHVGFYELNPTHDKDEQSARLGAFLLARILAKKFG